MQIAREVGVSKATVFRVLACLGLNRLKALEPAEPVRRYEREHPGALTHIDIKKLGEFDRTGKRITGNRHGQSKSRGISWEFVHVCTTMPPASAGREAAALCGGFVQCRRSAPRPRQPLPPAADRLGMEI